MNTPLNNQPTLLNLGTQSLHTLISTTIIGRHEDCNLVLKSERGASRKHARITIENNTSILMDLGSLNGTMVNGREISRAVQLTDGDILVFDEQEYRFNAPDSSTHTGGENVTVIANKDEIGRPESIKPAIRVVDPIAPQAKHAKSESLDDTEAWEVPAVDVNAAYPSDHRQDQHTHTAIPATSRPGGYAPTPKRLKEKPYNSHSDSRHKKKWSRWFVVIPLLILLMLIAFYFAYTAGLTAGLTSGVTGSS